MRNDKVFQVTQGQLVLNDSQAYDMGTGEVFNPTPTDKVRLQNIANYLTKRTGMTYLVHTGIEDYKDVKPTEECILIAPENYNIVTCGAVTDVNKETFDFVDLNKDGVNVWDNNVLFFWSFDMCIDNQGYFIHADLLKNGGLTFHMLAEQPVFSDDELSKLQNS